MIVNLLWITPNAEKVIELSGRVSYLSFGNMKEGSEADFIRMLIRKGHHSVLEHASASFMITGVSRTCTHQLVRHRLASYTMQSQRHLSEESFDCVVPESIADNEGAMEAWNHIVNEIRQEYKNFTDEGILWEDARFLLPQATKTSLVMTANLREWRHIFDLRISEHAQWEIRELMSRILLQLKVVCPNVFYDYEPWEEKQ